MLQSGRPLLQATVPVFSSVTHSTALFGPVAAMSQTQFSGVAVQNPGTVSADVTVSLYSAQNVLLGSSTITRSNGPPLHGGNIGAHLRHRSTGGEFYCSVLQPTCPELRIHRGWSSIDGASFCGHRFPALIEVRAQKAIAANTAAPAARTRLQEITGGSGRQPSPVTTNAAQYRGFASPDCECHSSSLVERSASDLFSPLLRK